MFEGEGLLVLKDGFSGFVLRWDAKAYNAITTEEAVMEWSALFGVPKYLVLMAVAISIISWLKHW